MLAGCYRCYLFACWYFILLNLHWFIIGPLYNYSIIILQYYSV